MRRATIKRETKETNVIVNVVLDGSGEYSINTPIAFFNHMLELLSKHSLLDLEINAQGDVDVDFHHTVEDVGIVFGMAIKKALGNMQGIRRYGLGKAPMDETLTEVVLDISGRPAFVFRGELPTEKAGNFDLELVPEFFKALAYNIPCAIHIKIDYGTNAHHIVESIFKSFALALRQAIEPDSRRKDIPSTKGII